MVSEVVIMTGTTGEQTATGRSERYDAVLGSAVVMP
jgi:hypothetical protein